MVRKSRPHRSIRLDADPENMHAKVLNSRHVVSMPKKPIPGSIAPRKLDIGFATQNGADDRATIGPHNRNLPIPHWKGVLVPGELKEVSANNRKLRTGTISEDTCVRCINHRTLVASAAVSHFART